MNKKEFVLDQDCTLIKFLKNNGFSFLQIKEMLNNKDIKLNNKRLKEDTQLKKFDKLICFYNFSVEFKKEIEIFYEDNNIIIVNKPEKIETTGPNGLEGILKAYAVHRLDTNTCGLVIFAKTEKIKEVLKSSFALNLVKKRYLCEVLGKTNFDNRVYSAYLFKDSKKSKVYIYNNKKVGCQEIKTKFFTVKNGNITSIVIGELVTGKTHQIRAHLAYLGHPILGDSKYGNKEQNRKFKQNYQKLFCFQISFAKLNCESLKNLDNKIFTLYPDWFKPNPSDVKSFKLNLLKIADEQDVESYEEFEFEQNPDFKTEYKDFYNDIKQQNNFIKEDW